MTRKMITFLAVLTGIQSWCGLCGAGPYGEVELAVHRREAHGLNY